MQKATGSYCTYSNPCKTTALFREFAVEDLPLSRTATLVPGFAVKDLPVGRILIMMMIPIDSGHVARMEQSRNAYRVLVGKPEGKRPVGRPRRK